MHLAKRKPWPQYALSDIWRSVAALRMDPIANQSLPDTFKTLLEETLTTGIQSQLIILGTPRKRNSQTGFTFYRAVQEGLTNVRKYPEASQDNVVLNCQDPYSTWLTIRDDGVGKEEINQGFGLLGIRERAQLLGGEVSNETGPG